MAEPAVLDYPALLETLDNGSIAFLANRIDGHPAGHSWPSREDAITAILAANAVIDDNHPHANLLWRFFTWGLGNRGVP